MPLGKTALRIGLELMMQKLDDPARVITSSMVRLTDIDGVNHLLANAVHSRFDDSIRTAIRDGVPLRQLRIKEDEDTLTLDEKETERLEVESVM